jgi:hypothetical protein
MKKYDLIYTDPAWSYNKKVGQGIVSGSSYLYCWNSSS